MKKDSFIEEEILLSLAKGDEYAFQFIYERYSKSVYKVAFRYLQSSDLAKDIVQEVFLAIWHKRETFTGVHNLESYLVSMACHRTFREMKKAASEALHHKVYSSDLHTTIDDSDFLIRTNEYTEFIAEAIDILPPQQKRAFMLSRMEGQTHDEIAKEMNVSPGTVKNHIVRALRQLRLKLSV